MESKVWTLQVVDGTFDITGLECLESLYKDLKQIYRKVCSLSPFKAHNMDEVSAYVMKNPLLSFNPSCYWNPKFMCTLEEGIELAVMYAEFWVNRVKKYGWDFMLRVIDRLGINGVKYPDESQLDTDKVYDMILTLLREDYISKYNLNVRETPSLVYVSSLNDKPIIVNSIPSLKECLFRNGILDGDFYRASESYVNDFFNAVIEKFSTKETNGIYFSRFISKQDYESLADTYLHTHYAEDAIKAKEFADIDNPCWHGPNGTWTMD